MNLPTAKRATREEICKASVPLFACRGYEGVSMREIAAAVGIQAAALYYHFPDKHSLHFAVMEHVFKDRMTGVTSALNGEGAPFARLQDFIAKLVKAFNDEPFFLLLLQRERLDGDEARHKLLMDHIFAPHIRALISLLAELAPEKDPVLLASSISGMVLYHLEWRSTARLLPEWKPEHDDPGCLVQHVCGLLRTMFGVDHEIGKK